MNIKLLIRNEIKNSTQNYATVYDIMDAIVTKYPQAAINDRGKSLANSTVRREISRLLDESCNWERCGVTKTGRKLYERIKSTDLSEFTQ
ncbi:hypothetical protein VPHD480_0203 [Vibrio phage D480]|nr:hypothetical protein MYOV011v1_p0014 [Vibrio phage 6E35.1a]